MRRDLSISVSDLVSIGDVLDLARYVRPRDGAECAFCEHATLAHERLAADPASAPLRTTGSLSSIVVVAGGGAASDAVIAASPIRLALATATATSTINTTMMMMTTTSVVGDASGDELRRASSRSIASPWRDKSPDSHLANSTSFGRALSGFPG